MFKIIQWATGNVGKASLRSILETPDYELVGLYVYSDEKVGKDAGEIVGMGKSGIAATNNPEAIIALDADCVVFNGLGDTKDPQASEDMICRLLASGKNVVSTAITPHIHKVTMSAETREKLESACREGGVSFYSTGVNPGYSADLLPISVSAILDRIDHIHCIELVDMAHYSSGHMVHEAIGMGQPESFKTPMENDGPPERNAYYTSALFIQDAFGIKFDDVRFSTEKALAQHDIELGWGTVKKGTMCGLRMRLQGLVGGEPRYTTDMVWKVTDEMPEGWPTGDSSWLLKVEGDPAMECRIDLKSKEGRTVSHVTSMAGVNLIREVIAAEPGIKSRMDFPFKAGGRFPSQRQAIA